MYTFVVLYREEVPGLWKDGYNRDCPVLCYIQAENTKEAAKKMEDFLQNDTNGLWGEPTRAKNDQEQSIALSYDCARFFIFPCPNIEDYVGSFDDFC